MKKSKKMTGRVYDRLKEIYNEEDFLTAMMSALKNDYECEQLLRLLDKFAVQNPDNVLIIILLISNAGTEAKWKGEYLKDIDTAIENALLDESAAESAEDKDEVDNEADAEEVFIQRINSIDFHQTVEDAKNGDITAMWDLVNYIAVNQADAGTGEYDADRLYYDTLCDLAAKKETAAYIMLGDAVLHGTGCTQNAEEAIRWYKKAAKNGHPFGNECIGEMYYFGEYVTRDYKKAYKYYTKDEGRKSFCTLYHLAEMYRQGLYVKKDVATAYRYYSEIVYDGEEKRSTIDDYYWRACYRLSRLYVNKAYDLITTAENIYDGRGNGTIPADITKEEIEQARDEIKQVSKDPEKYETIEFADEVTVTFRKGHTYLYGDQYQTMVFGKAADLFHILSTAFCQIALELPAEGQESMLDLFVKSVKEMLKNSNEEKEE